METIEQLIYNNIEELVKLSRWAPLILKTITEEGRRGDGWCHKSYREWKDKDANAWAFWKTLNWAKDKGILLEKEEPPHESEPGKGKGRGKKRKAFRLKVARK